MSEIDITQTGLQPYQPPLKQRRVRGIVATMTGAKPADILIYGGAVRDDLLGLPEDDFDVMILT